MSTSVSTKPPQPERPRRPAGAKRSSAATAAIGVFGRFTPGRRAIRRPKSIAVIFCMVWVAIVLIVTVTVQWLPIHSYITPADVAQLSPGWRREFLGTDNIGRSTVSRLAYGARVSVSISFVSTAIGLTVGAILGLVSIYFGGIATRVIDIITNAVLSVPSLLLLLSIILALRPTIGVLIGALSLIFIPPFMRLTRANALRQMNREYVVAARAMGAGGFRLMAREVLPNTVLPLLSYAVLVLPAIIVTEGSLSFLGFGVQAPTPTWGSMIAQAQATLTAKPWPAIVPCVVLFLTVYSLNTLGDYIRSTLDIRDANL